MKEFCPLEESIQQSNFSPPRRPPHNNHLSIQEEYLHRNAFSEDLLSACSAFDFNCINRAIASFIFQKIFGQVRESEVQRNQTIHFAAIISIVCKTQEISRTQPQICDQLLIDEADRPEVQRTELRVLQCLEFNLNIELPHFHLQKFAQYLKPTPAGIARKALTNKLKEEVVRVCWVFLNDCMMNRVCVDYPPQLLAVGGLLIGLAYVKLAGVISDNILYFEHACLFKAGGVVREVLLEDVIFLMLMAYDDREKSIEKKELVKFPFLKEFVKKRY